MVYTHVPYFSFFENNEKVIAFATEGGEKK